MGSDRQILKEKLQASFSDSERHLICIRNIEYSDIQLVHDELLSYILQRFLLTPEECQSEVLVEMAELSLKKSQQLKEKGVDLQDISAGCQGISSAVAKKVLLMLAIQKGLDIKFEKGSTPYIETVWQLADAVREAALQK